MLIALSIIYVISLIITFGLMLIQEGKGDTAQLEISNSKCVKIILTLTVIINIITAIIAGFALYNTMQEGTLPLSIVIEAEQPEVEN